MTIESAISAIGGPKTREAIEALVAAGAGAIEPLLRVCAGERPLPAKRRTREGYEGLVEALARIARAHPGEALALLRATPRAREHHAGIAALTEIEGPESSEMLLEILQHSRGWGRTTAMRALLRRGDPRAAGCLALMLRDPDSTTAFCAVQELLFHGRPEDIDAISAYLPGAAIGGREYALDAVESVCRRHALALPEWHPGERLSLSEVELQGACERLVAGVIPSTCVVGGQWLASAETGTVYALGEGLCVGVHLSGRRLQAVVRDHRWIDAQSQGSVDYLLGGRREHIVERFGRGEEAAAFVAPLARRGLHVRSELREGAFCVYVAGPDLAALRALGLLSP